MKGLSFYEQVGIVIPGAVFMLGLTFYLPRLEGMVTRDISLGEFGLFLLISYAAGHLVAALGNIIEKVYWAAQGGMPSSWVAGPKPRLLSDPQIRQLESHFTARFTSPPNLTHQTARSWFPMFRQIYADVDRNGNLERAEAFNGNYGLNRGLAAAFFTLAALSVFSAAGDYDHFLGLLAVGAIFLYRMHRFALHYAREVYVQFLVTR